MPFLAGLAVVRAVARLMPSVEAKLALKWPNDVMLDGTKLAGILVESMPGGYLVGLGLNLTRSPAMMASFPGIALDAAGTAPPRLELLDAITSCLSEILALYASSGWPALAGEYVRLSCTIGQTVRWINPNGTELVGHARGLTPDGALELVNDAGEVHQVHSGDVIAQGRRH